MNKQQTVFVGLSGGVDSSVAALRLKKQGFNVIGVFIKVWHPDFLVCNWEAERLDAMRVAAHLDIPFLTCDAETEYRDEVAKYFIDEYRAGHTPNPDVMCNQYVKFGAFLKFAKKRGADFIATGHYAQKINGKNGFELHRGIDNNKDQTYFLWTLSMEQLSNSLFPIGDTVKEQIRKEAKEAGIPTASKKDSQGVCFLGHVNIHDFLSHYIELSPGHVLDETGNIIGKHNGAFVYTIGQRHGFSLNNYDTERNPMYVISKDIEENTITVSSSKRKFIETEYVNLRNVLLREQIFIGDTIEAQFRYRQKPFLVKVIEKDTESLTIQTALNIELPAIGQSCVLYKNSFCIGGGIIT